MTRRARRTDWRGSGVRLAFWAAALSVAALSATDVRSSSDDRAAVLLITLLVVYGTTVAGSRRRRT